MRIIHLSVLATLGLSASVLAQDVVPGSPTTVTKAPSPVAPPLILKSSTSTATTIFSNVVGHPSADVPGFPGLHFDPGTGSTHFDRVFGSPNGNWILTALTDDVTTADEVLLVNGVVVLKEGSPAPWDPSNNVGPFDTQVMVNDAGDYVFTNNLAPTSTNDDYVIKVTPGPIYSVVAQEGAGIPGLPGVTYDDTLDTVVLLGNGAVGFEADLIDGAGITTATDDILELGGAIIAQSGVTVPAGQAGGGTAFAEAFDLNSFFADPGGATVLWQGDLTGSTASDDVVVVNNTVVLQEGSVIPGSSFTDPIDLSGIVNVFVDAGGNWYARGNNDVSEQDWVVQNGVVIAAVGQPIVAGSTEVYDDTDFGDCFFAHTGNSFGDYVIGGVTNADSVRNGVLVFNGTDVIARENDPVDLDNDGTFDDGVYFHTFGNDDLYLSDSNELFFVAVLRDASGSAVAQGTFVTTVNTCNGGGITAYGSGCTEAGGVSPPILSGIGCANPGANLTLSITAGTPFTPALLFIGVTQVSLPVPVQCTLLVSPITQITVPLDANGSITLPLVIPPTTPAVAAYLQAFNLTGTSPFGYRSTNGLELDIQ